MPRAKPTQGSITPLFTLEGARLPVVAIIGRPNVGKSTLFNRILGTRAAIVDDVPGVTRDRNYADTAYRNRSFRLVDTGGLDPTAHEGMLALIRQQSQLAIAEADILILVLDGRTGLTPPDEEVVHTLRGTEKPVFFVINKIDTPKADPLIADFYRLGQERLYPLSAEHGIGVAELLDDLFAYMADVPEAEQPADIPRIAIVGRPNVGKSTLVNSVLGETRVVVSDMPGTTRDPVDSVATFKDRQYVLTDTAGIRRRGRVERGIEGYSVARSLRAIGRSDVAVLLLDAVEGVTEQDTKIAGLVLKQGRACILVVNKWDLKAEDVQAREAYKEDLERRFPFLAWAPILFISALESDFLRGFFALIDQVYFSFCKRIPTGPLNQFFQALLAEHPLPVRKGKPTKASKSAFVTQVATKPPAFALFVGHPEDMTPVYLRYLENQLRKEYRFSGTPLRLMVRKK
jgi:GTP-binding protein